MYKSFFSKKQPKVGAFIIGSQKAATTSLFTYLVRHPQIEGSSKKEVHYFDNHQNFSQGDAWYHKHFTYNRKSLNIEATPRYLYAPHVPQRLFEFNSKAKLIIVLRNPVERAYSAWNMYRQMSEDTSLMNVWLEKGKLDSQHRLLC